MSERTESHSQVHPVGELPIDKSEPDETKSNDVNGGERSISLERRIRSPRTLISFLAAFAIIAFVFQNLDLNVGSLWRSIRQANPYLLVLAFLAYYGSFPLRAIRWRVFLGNAQINSKNGFSVPGIRGLSEIYLLGWFANCVVPAKLGDAYRGYLLKKHAGPSFSRTIGTIFAERFIDVIGLIIFMLIAAILVFGGHMPAAVQVPMIAGAGLAIVGVGGLTALYRYQAGIQRILPDRIAPYYERFGHGVTASFGRKGAWIVVVTTAAIWTLEGVRLFMVAAALHIVLGPWEALFVALLASLLTVVPITPAGLGVVESGAIIALKLLDLTDGDAAAVALVDRGVAYWSVILFGALAYLFSKHR